MALRMLHCLLIFGLMPLGMTATLYAAEKPSDEYIKMIVDLIGDPDREFRAAALDQVRTSAKGSSATQLFAAQLTNLDAGGQTALLSALADRGDVAGRPAVLEVFNASKDDQVRAAAVAAMGSLGSDADLPLLIKELALPSGMEQRAARRSLVQIAGSAISKTLASESKGSPPPVRTALIEVLTTRRASEESPAFIAASVDESAQVRSAAMTALGQLGRPEQLAGMLPGVLKAQRGGERDNAERHVAMVCARVENEEQRGKALIDALGTVPEADRDELLPLVGRVGGKTLINFVGDIAGSGNAARRKIGIDALSKWPDASVADKLLEIANKATDPAERNQAFQGYVKTSAIRDNRSDKQRLDRMKEAMKAAKSPEEQTVVINRTRTAYSVESVRFVLPYVDEPQFAQIACETIVEIAHHRDVRDPNKAEFDKVLDKVIEVSNDPVVVDRAQRYKRGQTWERPKR